jgi:hypothetical protein
VIHIVVAGYIVDHYCLRFDREVVCIVEAAYIVDQESLLCQTSNSNGQQYNSHNNMNHSSVKYQKVMVNKVTSHNKMKHSFVKHETVMVNNITATTI